MSTMISFCGLDCASCPAHVAYLTDDNALREKTAREWSEMFHADFKPEMVNCVGCTALEGVHIGHCAECAIRTCAQERKVENCAVCQDYGCSTLTAFIAQVPQAKATLEGIRQARGL